MKLFSIAGWSDSGKTTLIARVTEIFRSKNKKVCAVKNIPHRYHLQPEAKDSFTLLAAGCSEVFLVARNEIVDIQRNDKDGKIFEILASRSAETDYVLLEGLIRENIPVIEVFDSQKNEAPKTPLTNLCAMVTQKEKMRNIDLPVFDFDDVAGVVAFMENYNG